MLTQRKGHVIEHTHVGKQRTELKQHAHATARRIKLLRVHRRYILPIEQHLPLLSMVLAADKAQHRRLATARCPHQSRDLATRHFQRKIAQDDALTIAKGDIAQLHKGCVR